MFISTWLRDLHSGDTYIARTYRLYISSLSTKCYLTSINDLKFKVALSKLKASSHGPETDCDRLIRPDFDSNQRFCLSCRAVEDDEHFVIGWIPNEVERALYIKNVKNRPIYHLTNRESCLLFLTIILCEYIYIYIWWFLSVLCLLF